MILGSEAGQGAQLLCFFCNAQMGISFMEEHLFPRCANALPCFQCLTLAEVTMSDKALSLTRKVGRQRFPDTLFNEPLPNHFLISW